MLNDWYNWAGTWWDWDLVWFAILGGALFGVWLHSRYRPEYSSRPVFDYGVAIYFTFVSFANLHRFITSDPTFWRNLWWGGIRWWLFIFTILVTTAILKWLYRRRHGDLS